jgi:hypothetical protein
MSARNVLLSLVVFLGACPVLAQNGPPPENDSLRNMLQDLQSQIRDLRASVQELRAESNRYRAETLELRHQLVWALAVAGSPRPAGTEAAQASPVPSADQRLNKVEEDVQLLSGKVDEQYQTKVESASKYRVRLSGIALFNLFENRGAVDNLDNPALAQPRTNFDTNGSFGGTLRQSIVGLEVFGPQFAGARTSADVQADFNGGLPDTANGVTFGVVRLRTARLRLQWTNTSIIGGQDSLFFAPLAPSSFASLSSPSLSYAGNLWAWVPQLRVEHKMPFSDGSSLNFAAGILDGVTGELPVSEYLRPAQAGEKAGQPAYAGRVAWSHTAFGRPLTLGAGGYYNRQNWGFQRNVDGWAVTSDLDIPLGRWFSVSSEFYRGRAIGGLGAATARSIVFSGDLADPATQVRGLDAIGGWAQLKFAPTAKLEFNGAFGQDNPFAADLRTFTAAQNYINPAIARNRAALVNMIVRPRSDLLFSVEYRRLHTFELPRTSDVAGHINIGVGVLF